VPQANSPLLCYVTDLRALAGAPQMAAAEGERGLLDVIERVAAAGVQWIQIREKDLPAARLATLVRAARRQCPPSARIVVNDRLDVVLSAGADGIHLGEMSLPPAGVVALLRERKSPGPGPESLLVGVSTHSLDAARAAELAGAAYVFFGPVFETPSKRIYGAPQGMERLAEVCRRVRIPVLAIGGITAANARQCFAVGAAGIAAIRLFQESADPSRLVRSLLSEL